MARNNLHDQPVAALGKIAAGGTHRSPPAVAGVVAGQTKAWDPVSGIVVLVVAAAAADILATPEPLAVHHTRKDFQLATGPGIDAAAVASVVVLVPKSDKRRAAVRWRREPAVPRDMPRWDSRPEPTHHRCLQKSRSRVRVRTFPQEPRPSHRHLPQNYPLKDRYRASTSNADLSWIVICHPHD